MASKALQGVEAVVGHHLAGLLVVLAAPGELFPVEGELAVGLLGQGVQHPTAGGHDLLADTVGGDRGDLEGLLCHDGLSHLRWCGSQLVMTPLAITPIDSSKTEIRSGV